MEYLISAGITILFIIVYMITRPKEREHFIKYMNDEEFFAYQLPAYMLHHVSFGKQLHRFRIEFKINNLLNTDYQTILWRAMPGRSYEIYLEFKL